MNFNPPNIWGNKSIKADEKVTADLDCGPMSNDCTLRWKGNVVKFYDWTEDPINLDGEEIYPYHLLIDLYALSHGVTHIYIDEFDKSFDIKEKHKKINIKKFKKLIGKDYFITKNGKNEFTIWNKIVYKQEGKGKPLSLEEFLND